MDRYIVFDFETSNLNSKIAEIIEISAIRVIENSIIDEFSTLVKPINDIDPAATDVNGITSDMVKDSPSISEVLPSFLDFIGDDCLLGYNIASYDLPILRRFALDVCNKQIGNDYLDILYLAKKRLSFLPNCKLSTVSAYFNIPTENAHRALADCHMAKCCYERLLELSPCEPVHKKVHKHKVAFTEQTKALQTLQGFLLGVIADNVLAESEVFALKNWLDDNSNLSGQYPFDQVFAVIEKALEDGVLEQCELDYMLLLFKKFTSPTDDCSCFSGSLEFSKKSFCLTGDFNYGSRSDVKSLIEHAGGLCKNSVSGKIDYVIVGSLGSPDWSCGNYGTKIKKALELQSKGYSLQIVNENDFINALRNMGVIS